MTVVWIASVEGNDYARAAVFVFATEQGAKAYIDGVKEQILDDDRKGGYEDVPATIEAADEADYFDGSDGVYFNIDWCEVQP